MGGHFLEDCFYCYSQQTESAIANEALVSYGLIKRDNKLKYSLFKK